MRERSPMTCRKSSSRTALRSAAMLFLPFGGKTSPWGDGRSVLALLRMTWRPLLNNVCTVALAQCQIAMSQHDQCNMAVKTSPTPPLIMIEPQFSFGVLIESLNYPAYMSNFNQLLQAESIQFPGKIIFTILQASGLRDGAFNQEPTSDGQMCTTMPAAKHFYPGKLLDQRPLCAHPPCNSLPSFGRQSLRDFSGAQSRNAIFEGRSLSWLTSSTIRRRRWIPLILVNQFGIAKLNNRTCRRNMWNSQSNQTIEQRRLIPITGVDHHYPKGNLRPEGPIDQ